MKRESVIDAKIAALEFISRCNAVLKDPDFKTYHHFICGNKNSGALRRQSMELTRKLAEMRKP